MARYGLTFLVLAWMVLGIYFPLYAAENIPTTDIIETIRRHALFVPPVKEQEFFLQSADTPARVQGFLRRFDRYAHFYTAEEYAGLIRAQRAVWAGVGMEIVRDRTGSIVCVPYPDSPAALAGLIYGDRLLKVDGRTVSELELEDIAALVRGEAGSPVSLHVERPDGKFLIFSLQRARTRLPTVRLEASVGGRTRVRIYRFGPTTLAELTNTLSQAAPAQSLILDLRGNTGGDMQAGVDGAALFLPKGASLLHRFSRAGEQREDVKQDGPYAGLSVYIWQDELTASAAELFIAALTQRDRAVGLGRRTAGKAMAQEFFKLSDKSLLKLTVDKLLFPDSASSWQDTGIHPGIETGKQLDYTDALYAGHMPEPDKEEGRILP